MNAIYEPKGRAKEYAELACNLYRGCSHGCAYCYAPACLRMDREKFHTEVAPRAGILKALEHDAKKLSGTDKRVLLSFTSDPYQPLEKTEFITRAALQILQRYQVPASVLTKNGGLARRDFDLMQRGGIQFGSTIIFHDDGYRQGWEPGASFTSERMDAVREAHAMGIYTWISVEPVIDVDEALAVMTTMLPYVDFWKVGKLNYNIERERQIDWQDFLERVEVVLKGKQYLIKQDLLEWAGRVHGEEMIL